MEERYMAGIKCPGCDVELESYDVVCPWCGSKVKEAAGFSDEPDSKSREMRTIVEGALAYAITIVANGRRNGAKFLAAEAMIISAKAALANGDYPLALELASRSGQEAEDTSRQYDALLVRMGKAKVKIEVADERGGDVAEALELLEQARKKMDEGDYRPAIKLAIRSAAKADRSRMMHDAWKVEVGDYL